MQEIELVLVLREHRVDSRLLATELGHKHKEVLSSIEKYKEQLESLGQLPFETVVGDRGGSAVRYALLNEDQCYFLLTLLRNNDRIVKAKLNLVKAFKDARKQLAQRDISRIDGKAIRRGETDAIQSLVEYARLGGSTSPEMYYTNITKMTNAALGIEAGQRDSLDGRQLHILSIAERLVDLAIRDGVKANLPYQDIYRLCKDRVSDIVGELALNKLPRVSGL